MGHSEHFAKTGKPAIISHSAKTLGLLWPYLVVGYVSLCPPVNLDRKVRATNRQLLQSRSSFQGVKIKGTVNGYHLIGTDSSVKPEAYVFRFPMSMHHVDEVSHLDVPTIGRQHRRGAICLRGSQQGSEKRGLTCTVGSSHHRDGSNTQLRFSEATKVGCPQFGDLHESICRSVGTTGYHRMIGATRFVGKGEEGAAASRMERDLAVWKANRGWRKLFLWTRAEAPPGGWHGAIWWVRSGDRAAEAQERGRPSD